MHRVFVFTYSADYRHSYIVTAVEVLTRLGERSRLFEVYATEELEEFRRDRLRDFNALLFLTSGEVPFTEEQKELLIEFVESGGGFIGVHNATASLYSFTRYGEMLGAFFHSHPWIQEAVFIVEDRDHPSTRHLHERIRVFDEIYVFRNWIGRSRAKVLISLDTSSVDMSKAPKEVSEFPIAWCRSYGKGRVFYTAFGHPTYRWREEWFQKHLLGGIAWVLGIEEALT